jgi:hypothetical protein
MGERFRDTFGERTPQQLEAKLWIVRLVAVELLGFFHTALGEIIERYASERGHTGAPWRRRASDSILCTIK